VRITNRDIWDSLQGLSGKLSDALRAFATHTAVAAGQVTDLQERVHVLEGKVQVLEVSQGKQEDLPEKVDNLTKKMDEVKSSVDRTSWVPTIIIPIITAAASALVVWAMHGFQ
jgi:hypothetical protein